ncbi:fibronectin type III domain-containing protein [Geomesophilobacter sediminis]|uniref:Fibronectin type III domain-containing protein n=1 Tax=Geomesophilobacter sediminis TaxID=2798584 RepID=A0A8J7LYH3_9BACT|nr:fibronectin type III domain-containing protein [Geomesophilobacter sediminis]MBJ6725071.1 fibronectin type III domain-containing protein [Geomesophilobacter sediminis]
MTLTLKLAAALLLALLALSGCNAAQGDAWRYDPGIPAQVSGLKAESGDRLVTLSWTGNPTATSYNVYFVSEIGAQQVTRGNGYRINTPMSSLVIGSLDNHTVYHFMVTALNRDGESVDSVQVSVAPGPIADADLTGVWYFHTLVTGPEAKWEQGTLTVDADHTAVVSAFSDSSGSTQAPPGFALTVDGTGALAQSGSGAWVDFHGAMGARKNLMTATWSPTLQSRAITIFQKKKAATDPDYTIDDISGTGSGQNPSNPYLQGNGPTRFVYHQLYSGASNEWEYCNAKVGQHGNIWLDQYKDVIYWDFSTPASKTVNYDYLWKVTSVGIDPDGLVSEYWNFTDIVDPVTIPSFNTLVPRSPHEVVFTGRMTADRTVVIGVGTTTDALGNNPRYFLRIMQLCFIPTDQALPQPGVNDLAGSYKFARLAATTPAVGAGTASWAYGTFSVGSSGAANFTSYADSGGSSQLSDTFTLALYPDPNPDQKSYTDFANFTTPAQDGRPHYYGTDGTPLRRYYDFASYGSTVAVPSTWRLEDTGTRYYNEHGSLSYNRDLFVMTRTDASGYGMLVGLK